jgi:purine-binding chemotaxis protein CheW
MPDRDYKTVSGQHTTLVTFGLGSQTYALPIAPVRQIIEMVTITPLPQINHTVAGVINFHGTLVPVINLRRHLSMDDAPLQLHTPIILVNISERLVGLIVDQVLDVLERTADQIIDPNNLLPEGMGDIPLLQGLIHYQDGSILILNLEQLFKSSQTRSLLEAVDTLTLSLHQDGSSGLTGSDVSILVETPVLAENANLDSHGEPDLQPARRSNKRSKKVVATPETTDEVVQ